MLTRLVRIVNIAIVVLVLALGAAVYWLVLRPLPKVSGAITAPVQAVATIKRDARGIPHIEASNWQDAIFLQGYVMAQDRLWQMDGLRRFGAGELSEVFGSGTVAQDQLVRRMRMHDLAVLSAARLPAEQRAVFVEFARGVNYFIRTHRGDYSLEFSLPGHTYDPRPWTIVDSLAIGLVMYRDQTDSASFDVSRGALFAAATDPARMKRLFPATEGAYVSPGSNAWAVSGARSVDGHPILANDPHLNYGIPPTWYLVHLKAPGLNVTGAALPGVPGVLAGHNEHIAWGFTSVEADVMDLYREQLDIRTGRYLFGGHPEQARLATDLIGVSGGKPVEVQTWITRHGPVIASDGQGRSYSLRWTANEGVTYPFWAIDHASNWQQFRSAAMTLAGPALNFVYADGEGNIGYQVAGLIPIRTGFDGAVPVDGASGNFEWQGYIAPDKLPSFYNPANGIVATANQDPFGPDFPYPVSGNFHSRYRIDQIRDRLNSRPKLSVDDMLAIQKDVYSAYDRFLRTQVLTAISHHADSRDLVRQAVDVLRRWDGQMDKDAAAPLITQLLSQQLALDLVRSNLKKDATSEATTTGIRPRPEVIEDLLRSRPAGWVPHDDWDSWCLNNLVLALDAGRKIQGTPVSHWRWGRILQWNFQHPVGKQLPFVSGYFNIGPVEMSGSSTTVKQTTATLGPSQRMVIDLGNLDASVQNLTTGESGAVASPHYKDEWPAYYVGKSFPMEFRSVGAKDTLTVRPGPE